MTIRNNETLRVSIHFLKVEKIISKICLVWFYELKMQTNVHKILRKMYIGTKKKQLPMLVRNNHKDIIINHTDIHTNIHPSLFAQIFMNPKILMKWLTY